MNINNIYDEINIFYDGTNIEKYRNIDYIKGFTTNPTLINKSHIKKKFYKDFANLFLKNILDKPVSFEVFADDLDEMISQARIIASWGNNIYVKIPICNSLGYSTEKVIKTLNKESIKLNITAVFSKKQIELAINSLTDKNIPNIISIFAGRISDTGRNAKEYVKYGVNLVKKYDNIKILWASVRELYNLYDAIECKCDIITIPDNIIEKFEYINKDLEDYSKETVDMFLKDSIKSKIIF